MADHTMAKTWQRGRLKLRADPRVNLGIGLGFDLQIRSWRRAYPWIELGIVFGPFSLWVSAAWLDDVALAVSHG